MRKRALPEGVEFGATPDTPAPARRWPVIVLAVALVATLAIITDRDVDDELRPTHDSTASGLPPPSLPPDPEAALEEAEATARRLALMINRGDSVRVLELLAPVVDTDLGTSQWPLLFGDAGWWAQFESRTVLMERRVTDSVRYFRTIPGAIDVETCSPRPSTDTSIRIVVDCSYTAFGGMRSLIGDRSGAHEGILTFVVFDGKVADVRRTPDRGDEAWRALGEWAATADPRGFEAVLGSRDGGVLLQPTYDGAAALEHIDLATRYAEEQGAKPLPAG